MWFESLHVQIWYKILLWTNFVKNRFTLSWFRFFLKQSDSDNYVNFWAVLDRFLANGPTNTIQSNHCLVLWSDMVLMTMDKGNDFWLVYGSLNYDSFVLWGMNTSTWALCVFTRSNVSDSNTHRHVSHKNVLLSYFLLHLLNY